MAEYQLYFTTTASTVVIVEAEDLEAAIDEAYNHLPAGICAQCSGAFSSEPGIDMSGDWELDEGAYTDYPED